MKKSPNNIYPSLPSCYGRKNAVMKEPTGPSNHWLVLLELIPDPAGPWGHHVGTPSQMQILIHGFVNGIYQF